MSGPTTSTDTVIRPNARFGLVHPLPLDMEFDDHNECCLALVAELNPEGWSFKLVPPPPREWNTVKCTFRGFPSARRPMGFEEGRLYDTALFEEALAWLNIMYANHYTMMSAYDNQLHLSYVGFDVEAVRQVYLPITIRDIRRTVSV